MAKPQKTEERILVELIDTHFRNKDHLKESKYRDYKESAQIIYNRQFTR